MHHFALRESLRSHKMHSYCVCMIFVGLVYLWNGLPVGLQQEKTLNKFQVGCTDFRPAKYHTFGVKFIHLWFIHATFEELSAKTVQVMIFSDFLKYWEIWGFFHSCTVF